MIPKSINVFGERYRVKIDPDLQSAGLIEPKKKLIRIKPDTKEEMEWSYLHECLHGVFEEGRLNEAVEDGLEEVIIEQIVKFLLKNFTVKPK